MKITFNSKNGCCPSWTHNGVKYYLYEDEYDGSWTLKSKRLGFVVKDRFYGTGIDRIYPTELLKRYFKTKDDVKCERRGSYTFYYWKDKMYATDGEIITVQYQERCERFPFDSYLECLRDAKKYLSEKYAEKQIRL